MKRILSALLLPLSISAAFGMITLPTSDWVTVTKIRPTDCRMVRAFYAAPVDGATNSYYYAGGDNEWPTDTVGAEYDYTRDGLHITLADSTGVDAIILRGGASVEVHTETGALLRSVTNRLYTLTTESTVFPSRIVASQLAFFAPTNGEVADLGFFRVATNATVTTNAAWRVGSAATMTAPTYSWDATNVWRAMTNRYTATNTLSLSSGNPSGSAISFTNLVPRHFLTPAFSSSTGLVQVAIVGTLSAAASGTLVVHDPLDPRLDALYLPFSTIGTNLRLSAILPPQVVLSGYPLWITLTFNSNVSLAGLDGNAPQVAFEFTSADSAKADALAWRLFLVKTFHGLMSEPGPWAYYTETKTADEFFATLSPNEARRTAELFSNLDAAYGIDSASDLVREYREWIYLRHLTNLVSVTVPEPAAGVPSWAHYSRLAWLKSREIFKWWMDNRVTPDGGLGGFVSDDSDWYGEAMTLPMFEADGVGGTIKTNCWLLGNVAWTNYLTGGINKYNQDALHAYEEGINLLGELSRLYYGNATILDRCRQSATNIMCLTVTNNGHLYFRDRYNVDVGSCGITPDQDGYATPLLWHTTFAVADYDRTSGVLTNAMRWVDNWLRFQTPGNYANIINVESETVYDHGYALNSYGQPPVFHWAALLTGNTNYLRPWMDSWSTMTRTYPATFYVDIGYNMGMLDGHQDWIDYWADLNPSLALYAKTNYSVLTNWLLGPTTPYAYQVTTLVDAYRFPDVFTAFEPFVDRVQPVPLLEYASRAYLGGFERRNEFSPKAAVSWEGLGTNYAALVTWHRPNGLRVALYNITGSTLSGNARLWELATGAYQVSTGPDANGDFLMDSVTSTRQSSLGRNSTIALSLPANSTTLLNVASVAPSSTAGKVKANKVRGR